MAEETEGGVVLKSEMHTSRGDLEEELSLLQEQDFDALVVENARESVEEIPEPTLIDRIIQFPFFFLGPIYTDNTPLLAAANKSGTDLYYTRESDGDVVEDLPAPIPQIVQGIWLLLVLLTVVLATGTGFYLLGSLIAYGGLFLLPIAVRVVRGQLPDDRNRNTMMSNTIREAHDNSGRTLAILGNDHTDEVAERLPDDIIEDRVGLAYPLKSFRGLWELIPKLMVLLYLIVSVWVLTALLGSQLLPPLLAALL